MLKKLFSSAFFLVVGLIALRISLTARVPTPEEMQVVTGTVQKTFREDFRGYQRLDVWLADEPRSFTYTTEDPKFSLVQFALSARSLPHRRGWEPQVPRNVEIRDVEMWVDKAQYLKGSTAPMWQLRKQGEMVVSYDEVLAVRKQKLDDKRLMGKLFGGAMVLWSLLLAWFALRKP